MDYGRLGKPEPGGYSTGAQTTEPNSTPNKKSKLKILIIAAATLMVASAISTAAVVVIRNRVNSGGGMNDRRPSKAMSRACSRTRYPTLCVNSLLDFPGALAASDKDLVHISVNMTLQKIGRALSFAAEINNLDMDPHVRSAYDDCLELLDHSVDQFSRSLTSVAPGGEPAGSTQDVITWLSAALTNQDTCTEGFDELNGDVKNQMSDRLKDLSELVSNSLAIYAAADGGGDDFSNIPIQNRRRRRLLTSSSSSRRREHEHQFPMWLSKRERRLLDMPVTAINADIIVSKDGNGTYKTIAEAIKKAPEHSNRRFIIYVRAGRYEENKLKVGRKKTNIMFIGDGKGKTVISGGKSVQDKLTTFHTASFGKIRSTFGLLLFLFSLFYFSPPLVYLFLFGPENDGILAFASRRTCTWLSYRHVWGRHFHFHFVFIFLKHLRLLFCPWRSIFHLSSCQKLVHIYLDTCQTLLDHFL
ncbi:hypothetical protein ABFX02_06G101700 [Erythranthe guttata]